MIADLADHRLRCRQPANHVRRQPRVRLDERLHRRGKTNQIGLQTLPGITTCPGDLPALEDLFSHQALERLDVRHVLVQRHMADPQSGCDTDKGEAGQPDGNAHVGNAFTGDGTRAPASGRSLWRFHGVLQAL
ncbi:hypothetical protein D3C76_1453250 [compost metagenome]